MALIAVLTDEQSEDGRQKHEYQRLDEADEDFHEVKGDGDEDGADGLKPCGVLDEI